MHILQVHYDTGGRIDFAFSGEEAAAEAKAALDNAISAGKARPWAVVSDDHGRKATVRLDRVLAVVLSDIAAEAAGANLVRQEASAGLGVPMLAQQQQEAFPALPVSQRFAEAVPLPELPRRRAAAPFES